MCPDLWITSLLLDLNYEFINGSFASVCEATEVSSMPESKRTDPIQVCTAACGNILVLKMFLIFWMIRAQVINVQNRFYKN